MTGGGRTEGKRGKKKKQKKEKVETDKKDEGDVDGQTEESKESDPIMRTLRLIGLDATNVMWRALAQRLHQVTSSIANLEAGGRGAFVATSLGGSSIA